MTAEHGLKFEDNKEFSRRGLFKKTVGSFVKGVTTGAAIVGGIKEYRQKKYINEKEEGHKKIEEDKIKSIAKETLLDEQTVRHVISMMRQKPVGFKYKSKPNARGICIIFINEFDENEKKIISIGYEQKLIAKGRI